MADKNLTIRPFARGDETQINDLFNKIFQKSRPLDAWHWKYMDNPAMEDVSKQVAVIEKEGAIVGHYGGVLLDMKVRDKILKLYQPVDTMKDREAKIGLKSLRRLYHLHMGAVTEIALLGFGFPNEKHYTVGKKLFGYKDLGEFIGLFRRLSFRSALKRRWPSAPAFLMRLVHRISRFCLTLKLRERNDYQIDEATSFDDWVETLWEEEKDRYGITPVRSKRYLSWRYEGKGFHLIRARKGDRVCGYAVLCVDGGEDAAIGYVFDFFSSEDATGPLLQAVLRFFAERDADFARCGVVRGSPMERDLQAVGFYRKDAFPPSPMAWVPFHYHIDHAYVTDPANWHIFYGVVDCFLDRY